MHSAVAVVVRVRAFLSRRARMLTANVVSLAGVAVVCIGVSLWSVPLALIAAGLACVVVGQGIET